MFVSSHVMDEASRCDRLLLLRDGRILSDSTLPELLERTGTDDAEQAFLALIDAADRGRRHAAPAGAAEVRRHERPDHRAPPRPASCASCAPTTAPSP